MVRIWESEGCKLHSVGEAAPGLLGPIAWQPNGRHLYAAQQQVPAQSQAAAQCVVLFERNGLLHGELAVPGSGEPTLLAVCVHAFVQVHARASC